MGLSVRRENQGAFQRDHILPLQFSQVAMHLTGSDRAVLSPCSGIVQVDLGLINLYGFRPSPLFVLYSCGGLCNC